MTEIAASVTRYISFFSNPEDSKIFGFMWLVRRTTVGTCEKLFSPNQNAKEPLVQQRRHLSGAEAMVANVDFILL
jgi:hypothetical protein